MHSDDIKTMSIARMGLAGHVPQMLGARELPLARVLIYSDG